jgi:hypothetical protein
MLGHGCELAGAGPACVPADPEDDEPDGDELGDDDTAVVLACVVPAAPLPPVAASATPVAPAPTPAATMPVMTSRRSRPPVLETIWFLPS